MSRDLFGTKGTGVDQEDVVAVALHSSSCAPCAGRETHSYQLHAWPSWGSTSNHPRKWGLERV